MTRRHRVNRALPKTLTILFLASLLAVPAAQTGARQQNDTGDLPETGLPAQTLIGQQLEAGEIDFETSLVYRAYALFDDPRLPGDLAGGGSFGEDNALFGQLKYYWNDLSPDTQQLLTPFVARPNSSHSIYYASLADGTRTVPNVEAAPTYAQGDCSDNWISRDSESHPFKVWTHCTDDYDADLDEAIRITDDFWEREVAFMGPPIPDTGSEKQGGDSRIDIYFVDDETDPAPRQGGDYLNESALAHAAPDDPIVDRTSSAYIVARRPMIGDDRLKVVMAHEFFHVLQDAHNYEIAFGYKEAPFNADFETISYSEFWFVEATATWVEIYLYRDSVALETMQLAVHHFLYDGWQPFDLPLYYSSPQFGTRFLHVYGAYIYFLFLEQEVGPQAMAQLWIDLEGVEPSDFDRTTEVINDILPFDKNFREFTVRNLNMDLLPGDPITPSYRDIDPTFPEGMAPPFRVGDSPSSRILVGPGHAEPWVFEDPIPSLAAHYYDLLFQEPVTRITLDFTGLTDVDDVDVDLITKVIQQPWARLKLDPSKPIVFCRENEDEAIRNAYLIVTNHDMEEANAVRGSFTISWDDEPCGTTDATPEP